jgi:STAS domain
MAMPDRSASRPSPGTGPLTIRPLQGRAGLMLAGEADITTLDALRAALAALPADGTGDIHLDLTGLRFIDLSCTRELIAITGRHPAVRLIAHDPPACLLRITALIYPQAKITFMARSRPDTGTAGSTGPGADPAGDGCGSDPGRRTGGRPAAAERCDDASCRRPAHR